MVFTGQNNWLPDRTTTFDGAQRRAGIEIELAGISPYTMSRLIQDLYGGDLQEKTRFEFEIIDTELGDFIVELDSDYLKTLAEEEAEKQGNLSQLESIKADLLTKVSELLVPWEIVTAPIALKDIVKLTPLIEKLRKEGALGTRYALHYAFGVHLNPELPDLDSRTIVNYLRAYFCLYDWIVAHEKVDLMRKLTPYIKHFDKDYIRKIIDWNYHPDRSQLIDDYLLHNPTRNRSMDMLPLFAHLDAERVRNVIDDPRIKSRPTFHYRLPNCDIDNPEWNLDHAWNLWLEVEKLSADDHRLKQFCDEYGQEISRIIHPMENRWLKRTLELLKASD